MLLLLPVLVMASGKPAKPAPAPRAKVSLVRRSASSVDRMPIAAGNPNASIPTVRGARTIPMPIAGPIAKARAPR